MAPQEYLENKDYLDPGVLMDQMVIWEYRD